MKVWFISGEEFKLARGTIGFPGPMRLFRNSSIVMIVRSYGRDWHGGIASTCASGNAAMHSVVDLAKDPSTLFAEVPRDVR